MPLSSLDEEKNRPSLAALQALSPILVNFSCDPISDVNPFDKRAPRCQSWFFVLFLISFFFLPGNIPQLKWNHCWNETKPCTVQIAQKLPHQLSAGRRLCVTKCQPKCIRLSVDSTAAANNSQQHIHRHTSRAIYIHTTGDVINHYHFRLGLSHSAIAFCNNLSWKSFFFSRQASLYLTGSGNSKATGSIFQIFKITILFFSI